MKNYILLIFLAISGSMTMISCFKENVEFQPYESQLLVSPTLFGYKDYNTGENLSDVEVSINSQNKLSSNYGTLLFSSARVDRDSGSLAQSTKDGYFPHFKFLTLAGKTRTIEKIRLVRDDWRSIQNIDQGTNFYYPNAQIHIPANTIPIENSQINFFFKTADDPYFFEVISGANQGVRVNNSKVSIIPVAYFHLESETQFANKIQLIADIHPSINETQILLWKLNTVNGNYEEVGTVDIEDDKFHCQIESQGHYLIGNAYPFVTLSGYVETDNIPIQDVEINLKLDNDFYLSTNTRNDGSFTFFAPQNIDLKMEILDFCGQVIKQIDISKLSLNKDLGKINLTSDFSKLTFSSLNCEGLNNNSIIAIIDDSNLWKLQTCNKNGKLYSILHSCHEYDKIDIYSIEDEFYYQTFQGLQLFSYNLTMYNQCMDVNYWMVYDGTNVQKSQIDDLFIKNEGDFKNFEFTLGGAMVNLKYNEKDHILDFCNIKFRNTEENLVDNEIRYFVNSSDKLIIESEFDGKPLYLQLLLK